MSKVVISGYYGFKNFGDEAILTVLVNHLKQLNCDITIFSSNPFYTINKHKVNSVRSFDILKVIDTLKKSDCLISGGGSLLQDATSVKSLLYYSFIIFLALIFKKKVIIFAQGIGPLNSFFSKAIVLNLLQFCTLVTVRDENSKKLMDESHINSMQVPDPIFSLQIKNFEKTKTVGIQLREFQTVTDEFLNELANFVINSYAERNIELISLHDTIDVPVLEKFKSILENKCKNINVDIIKNLSETEIAAQLATLDTLIAMRFHAVLIALKTGVKTLAINYDIKVQKLAEDFGIPSISLSDFTNYQSQFDKLKNEETSNNIEISSSKVFDWTEVDKII
ncbi:MAG: polysaccharide pyruvyl transferase CsaB [Clostridiaceae bacterium]|jgi:polysaccharide pyruvyl transferase CsaB|nr:polysaccharide pyruvyl transferase CsaB [Clostridiaceae bacterium]